MCPTSEDWNVGTAGIASYKPLVYQIRDKSEEFHVLWKEFLSCLEEARDVQEKVTMHERARHGEPGV